MKACWKKTILADSQETLVIEGRHYFPPNSVKRDYLRDSSTRTTCPWKGETSYYDLLVGGEINRDAAWYYPDPKNAARQIRNYVAFWKGVEVVP
jgi:uncharacterized protein (DUF427 family)